MARLLWLKFIAETAFRNLLRSPRRTAISLMAIASAAAAITVFNSFVEGVRVTFRKNVITSVYAHYQISPKGFRDEEGDSPLDYKVKNFEQLEADLKASGSLALLSQRQPFYGLINFDDRSVGGIGFGIEAEKEIKFLTLTQPYEGAPLAGSQEDSVYIGWKLAKRLRIKPGDMVTVMVTTSSGSLNAVDLQVAGTFKTGIIELDQGTFQVHLGVAQRLLRTEGAPLVLLAYNQDDELPFKKGLEQLMSTKYPDLEIVHWRKLADFFDNTMGWMERQVLFFRWIILLIASISIVNVFLMGLFERTGEFGTLRAIGTHRRALGSMILIESLLQAAIGSFLGLLLGMATIVLGLRAGITMPPPPLMNVPFHVSLTVPWSQLSETFWLCVVVCGGAGIYPAIKISRMGITEALGRNV